MLIYEEPKRGPDCPLLLPGQQEADWPGAKKKLKLGPVRSCERDQPRSEPARGKTPNRVGRGRQPIQFARHPQDCRDDSTTEPRDRALDDAAAAAANRTGSSISLGKGYPANHVARVHDVRVGQRVVITPRPETIRRHRFHSVSDQCGVFATSEHDHIPARNGAVTKRFHEKHIAVPQCRPHAQAVIQDPKS